jgi:hypothetical protein
VDLFINSLCLKEYDRILLIIDDTYNEKDGDLVSRQISNQCQYANRRGFLTYVLDVSV